MDAFETTLTSSASELEKAQESLERTRTILSFTERQEAHQKRCKEFPKVLAAVNSTKVKLAAVVAAACWTVVVTFLFTMLGTIIAPEGNVVVVTFWFFAGIGASAWGIGTARGAIRRFLNHWEDTTRDMLHESSMGLFGRPLEMNDLR